ncbi:MAG: hypothetical protein AAGD05_09800, partial [Bacteroidota bacterium]
LLVLDETGQQVHRRRLIDQKPSRLFKNCIGELHLITAFKAFDLRVDQSGIHLQNGIWLSDFGELVNPCVLATDNFVYFSQYYYQGQALKYHTRAIGSEAVVHQLPLIQDDPNICLLIEDAGLRLPHSGDLWEVNVSQELVQLREMDYRIRGALRMFYPKIYAPIYGKDSLIFVFNHPESRLQYFKETGEALLEIPIDYHHSKKWKKQVLVDEITGKAYTSFHTRWGERICPIHVEDGTLGPGVELDRAFVQKQKIRAGNLYFLYHNPYNGDRNRQLHKISIH